MEINIMFGKCQISLCVDVFLYVMYFSKGQSYTTCEQKTTKFW